MTTNKHTYLIGYIGEFEEIDDHRSGKIVIQLNGRLNKCGVISPRFNIKLADLEKWTSNLLPSRQFGYLVLTTSAGIMDHEEARRKHAGKSISRTIIHLEFPPTDEVTDRWQNPWFLLLICIVASAVLIKQRSLYKIERYIVETGGFHKARPMECRGDN